MTDAVGLGRTGVAITKDDLPALLGIAEDHGMALDISVFNGAGGQAVEMSEFAVRRKGSCIELRGPRWRTQVDLNVVDSVRAVFRGAKGCGRICVECFDCDARCVLSIAGPDAVYQPEGQVWQTLISTMVMDASQPEAQTPV